MKLFVLCFFAAFYMMFAAACSESRANASPADQNSDQNSGRNSNVRNDAKPFGETLVVKSVQQFQDRQPVAREDGAPVGPRTITVVNFEATACPSAIDRDFSIRVSKKDGTALAKIVSPDNDCAEPSVRSFRVGTSDIRQGEAVVVTNPTVIETLAPTE